VFKRIIAIFWTVILVGCATPQPAADDQYVAFARSFFELLQHKDFAAAKAKFDGEIEGDTLDTLLQLSVLLIPKDPPLSSKVVQYRSSRVDGKPVMTVGIDYEFPNVEAQFEITMRGSGDDIWVRHFKVHSEINKP
jgi:hypothetical protein